MAQDDGDVDRVVVNGSMGPNFMLTQRLAMVGGDDNKGLMVEAEVLEYLERNLDLRRYRAIPLGGHDTRFENRESPDKHRFRTAEHGPALVILERLGR